MKTKVFILSFFRYLNFNKLDRFLEDSVSGGPWQVGQSTISENATLHKIYKPKELFD